MSCTPPQHWSTRLFLGASYPACAHVVRFAAPQTTPKASNSQPCARLGTPRSNQRGRTVHVRVLMLGDVRARRVAGGVAPHVCLARALPDPDVVDAHLGGEGEVGVVDRLEAFGEGEVEDEVLVGESGKAVSCRLGASALRVGSGD